MIRFLQTQGKVQRVILVGFLSLICITMVAYLVPGLNDAFSGSTNDPNVLAKIGSHTVTIQEASREADRMIQQQYPRGAPAQLKQLVMPSAVNRLVMQNVFLAEAERLGLRVTDDELRYNLEHGPLSQYLFPEGKFIGDAGYKNFVASQFNNMAIPDFEELVKKDLLMQKLRLAVEGGVTVSDSELKALFNQENTKVKFDYAVITLNDAMKAVNPTDAEVRAFFEKNQAQFATLTPEQRKLRFMVADASKLPSPPKASEGDVQGYYNAHQEEYKVPESVTVRHILIMADPADAKAMDAAKVKAADVLKQLKAGGDFTALAKKYSDDKENKDKGGQLPTITRDTHFVPEFMQAAFSAQKGETVGPVKTQFGYHIIRVEDKTVAHQKTLAEVRAEIQPRLEMQKTQSAFDSFSRTLEAEARSQGMEKTAAAHGLTVFTSAFVTRGDNLPGVGTNPGFMDTMFGEKAGAPPVAVLGGPGIVIGQVAEIKPPSPASFDSVKAQIASQLKNSGAQEWISRKTQELSDKARAGHNLRAAAKAVGATVKTSDLVGTTQQIPDVGIVGRIPNIANMKPGEISGPVDAGGSGVVVALLEHQDPTDADFAIGKEAVKARLLDQKRQDAVNVYASALKDHMEKTGKVKIFSDRMKTVAPASGGDY